MSDEAHVRVAHVRCHNCGLEHRSSDVYNWQYFDGKTPEAMATVCDRLYVHVINPTRTARRSSYTFDGSARKLTRYQMASQPFQPALLKL